MKNADDPAPADGPPRRGRGRPRGFDRDEALGLAMLLFWSRGYEGTSIADLTRAIGIEPPSLYAAFGSKGQLFAEALRHYGETYEDLVWGNFRAAASARAAAAAYLADSAAALTGAVEDVPRGCMATLAAVDGDARPDLGALVRAARAVTFDRLEARFALAVAAGEIPAAADVAGLARFVQSVQSGMSILARDGAGRAQLEAVARISMMGWDEMVAPGARTRS